MNPTRFLVSVALAGATSLGCSGDPGSGASASFPTEALATLSSDSAALHVEVRTAPEQPPSRGMSSVEYRITRADGTPVPGLSLTVLPWMPDMGHGASIKPSIAEVGEGRYVISDVELFMPGKWELRTTIAGAAPDRATPAFQIP